MPPLPPAPTPALAGPSILLQRKTSPRPVWGLKVQAGGGIKRGFRDEGLGLGFESSSNSKRIRWRRKMRYRVRGFGLRGNAFEDSGFRA